MPELKVKKTPLAVKPATVPAVALIARQETEPSYIAEPETQDHLYLPAAEAEARQCIQMAASPGESPPATIAHPEGAALQTQTDAKPGRPSFEKRRADHFIKKT